MYLKIVNSGEIESAALTLLGASTKEGDSGMIGRFGSGNKYAIACLLRNNIPFQIWSGTHQIRIETEEVVFRDTSFHAIIIDGQKTSLTTRTGPEWEPWMAVREFLCNAIDEGGFAKSETSICTGGEAGATVIYVELVDALAQFAETTMHEILRETDAIVPDIETAYGKVSILPRGSTAVFRKGIRAWNNGKTLFSYDFDDVEINESRLIAYDGYIKERIASAFACCHDTSVIAQVLRFYIELTPGDTKFLEASLYWDKSYCSNELSEEWHDILLSFKKQVIAMELWQILPAEDRVHTIKLPGVLVERIKERWPDVPMYGECNRQLMRVLKPPKELAAAVKKACADMKAFGLPLNMPVNYARFATKETLAIYTQEAPDGRNVGPHIELSVDHPLNDPNTSVLSTLLHELMHHKSQAHDGTRAFDDCMLDELVQAKQELAKYKRAYAKMREIVNAAS